MRYFCVFIFHLLFICSGSCNLSAETREKYVNEFVEYLNNLPNQPYVFEEGSLLKYETIAENTYKIEANIKVSELNNADSVKFLQCSTTLQDLGESGISIQNNDYHCLEPAPEGTAPTTADDVVTESLTTEEVVERRPLQLDNEIQPGNSITSGEQFIAIPRDHPAPCIGCSTRVDPQAAGVNDLAALAIRHLDRHEPDVRHTLVSVVDVERQVQVVNGVRYILTLTVDYNNCTETETEGCNLEKPCKITVLEKPWVKLPDGLKYRAILANNCTADWLYGDNGEVLPHNSDGNKENNEINVNTFNNDDHADDPKDNLTPDYDKIANTGSVDDILKVIHKSDLQAKPVHEKKLTDEEMKTLQEQIIPLDKFKQYSLNNDHVLHKQTPNLEEKENVDFTESEKHVSDNASPVIHPVEKDDTPTTIPEDKKKAIDELMNFFSFSGIDSKVADTDTARIKRSYDPDIKAMNLVDRFQKLKGKLKNAKYLLTLGQSMVDYLNEMDMEVKSRVLNDVTAAEEESDNNRQFVYLQARISIPCEKAVCEKKDSEVELCNAIMDTTKRVNPQVLDAFCVAEEKKLPSLSYPGRVDSDDPVLGKLASLAVKKIEAESPYPNAFKIGKILSGVTQKISGTLTMISLVLEFLDCNKTLPHVFRSNCSTIDSIGTKVCEIQIHERPEFIEKSITYTCTDRPADESFSSIKYSVKQGNVNDPKVIEVAHEALQYLEVQSNSNNKPKIVEIKSVSSKLVAGMLTNVEFVVGYTTCTNDVDMVDINSCSLLDGEPLRLCDAQIWDRPWLEDGRQMKVSCKIIINKDESENDHTLGVRQKRSANDLHFVGGQLNKDTNDKKYIELAKESLQKYVSDSGTNKESKLVKLKKVTVQVVAGSLTRIDFDITPASNCVLNTETTLCDARASEDIITCHAEVWERPWLNSKEIKINCQDKQVESRKKRSVSSDQMINDPNSHNSRRKRQVPGGVTVIDPSDEKYKMLAEESLSKYLQTSGNSQEHKVVQVKDVSVQVVSGKSTKIHFTMTPKNCYENLSSKDCEAQMYDCNSEVWERPWLKSKEITVSCKQVENHPRSKRQMAGGIQEVDPTHALYKKLAGQSLAKYMNMSGITAPHKVIDIKKVTYQIVSGSMTTIYFSVAPGNSKCEPDQPPTDSSDECEKCGKCKINAFECKSEVWERPWLNSTEISVNCTKPISEKMSRSKRQVPGGATKVDPSDEKYKMLAEESLTKYLQTSGNAHEHKVVEVKDVSVQVVSGKLTKIHFTMTPKNCKDCENQMYDCNSEVWERPWLKSKEITVSCKEVENNSRSKRQIVGGITKVDPTDEKFKMLAEESLTKYLQSSGNAQQHKVVEVKNVSVQVVSGQLTRIHFTMTPKNCYENVSSKDCETQIYDCNSEVWERPWLKSKEITVSCKEVENQSRTKRQIPGGATKVDPTDEKFKALAEESLTKYLQTSGNTQEHKVVEVKDVSVQVVSGQLTKINFTMTPKNCYENVSSKDCEAQMYDCNSEVWERPWLKSKEITVSCKEVENNSRSKRQIVGGITKVDPTDEKFKMLAEESLTKYLQSSGNTQEHKLVEVKDVSVQVVSGQLTRIHFTMTPKNCYENISSKDCEAQMYDCNSEVWERPWLKSKEITVSCKEVENNSRNKRHILSGVSRVTDKYYQDEILLSLAKQSMQQYLKTSDNLKTYKIVDVGNLTTQFGYGLVKNFDFKMSPTSCSKLGDKDEQQCLVKTIIEINCHSTVWEKPWVEEPNKLIEVECDIEQDENNVDDNVSKQTNRLSGRFENQDTTQLEYRVLAEESLQKYQLLQSSTNLHKVIEVKRVMTQTVSGVKYKIDFTAAPTDCSINIIDKTSCIINNTVLLYCHSAVWHRPWLKRKEIYVVCKADVNDSNLNTIEIVDNDNNANYKQYVKLAEVATKKYQAQTSPKYFHKVTKILNVSEKTIIGFLTKIEFLISPTKCTLFEAEVNSDCELLENLISRPTDVSLICHASIWEMSASHADVVNVHCENDKEKKKELNLNNRVKRETGDDIKVTEREKRDVAIDDDVDDEIKYYYGQMIIDEINTNGRSQNIEKLITVHDIQRSVQMRTPVVRMYIETARTFCLRDGGATDPAICDEIEQIDHKICLARLYPSPDDELVVLQKSVVCNDDIENFQKVTGINYSDFVTASLKRLEQSPDVLNKLFVIGYPHLIPSLHSLYPMKLQFVVGFFDCPKTANLENDICAADPTKPSKLCTSFIWLKPNTKIIKAIRALCTGVEPIRMKRSVNMDPPSINGTASEEARINVLVQEALEHLEMSSLHRYKQRVLLINSYSTKITSRKVTTLDFDVGYTSCLKYEWVENVTSCEFLEHLPRRHCVAQVWEKLWTKTGGLNTIEVNCEDDETPLEAHIEFESAENAMQLAREALKHIEAKYPHPRRQKVVRIFSLEKQAVAGLHYRLKMEVGLTDCPALSLRGDCKLVNYAGLNKFCRVNVWIRPWTDHPPTYRVACDYQESTTAEMYHQIQAESLFSNFVMTYKPHYMNDDVQMAKRFEIFRDNVRRIHELNIYERGTARYAVTRFTDLSAEEFRARYLGLNVSLRDPNAVPMRMAEIPTLQIPDHFDWREFDAVTEVKDQGSCGSCWAFSVTGNIEGQWKMQSGQLVSLSEQELVDCDKLDNGCNGGLPDNAYRAIEQLGGLELETDYPYEGADDKCVYNKTLSRVQISGAVNISSNETEMAKWLVQNGPISIGINANAMQFYVGGVSHPWKMLCSPKNLDHGVLIVGYGAKDYPLFNKHLPYWIVKNSWGKSWGEQGYYRVYRGDGTCGVNMMASSAVV